MESGVYITFFDSSGTQARELPPVGPLEHVVVRHRELVAQRRPATEPPDLGIDIARWLEAELELQRATGEEPGGPTRAEMRIVARDGVYVRFAVFGDARERDLVPELGPFAVVVVGRRGLEADGQVLATRTSSELAAWELTSHAGEQLVGRHKPDVAFRTTTTAYHPQIAPLRARPAAAVAAPPRTIPAAATVVTAEPPAPAQPPGTAFEPIELPPLAPPGVSVPPFAPSAAEAPPSAAPEPLVRPPTPRAHEPYAPPAYAPPTGEEPPALTPADLALIQRIEQQRAEETLRARIQEEERRRLGVDESDDEATSWAMRYRTQPAAAEAMPTVVPGGGLDLPTLLWRLRFAIIGVLLLGVGAYGFTVIRTGGASTVPGQQPLRLVGIAERFSSARWDYIVNGVQRTETAGTANARGIFYVVRIGVTNRGTDGAQLSPGDFLLIDANGTEYRSESVAGGAYFSQTNTQSQFIWPQAFPIGKTMTISVIFDVDPSIGRGMRLAISDLPTIRVKLD